MAPKLRFSARDTPPGSDGADSDGWRSIVVHLCGLLVLVAGITAFQQFHALIALAIPLGPALVGRLVIDGPIAEEHRRNALGFAVTASVVIAIAWTGVRMALTNQWVAVTFPVFLLLLLLSITNYAVMSLVAAVRANRGERFEYPWVPDVLGKRLAAEPEEVRINGNR